MPEHQAIEWKELWHDEYLKWICGYANANGGTLYIGKDDKGKIVGIRNSKYLLESIPTKIRDTMGIVADVNLREQDQLEYLEIIVEAYPFPISYKGKYYYRSGSTMLEMTGAALDKFMLKKQGLTWDGVPIPYETVATLKKEAFGLFRAKALNSRRLTKEELDVSNEILLRNLQLYEGDYLKRAAIMTFHENPEKWVQGSYIKIGFFGESDSDLLYQDEIHGPLIEQVDKAADMIYQKYMKALISYEDMQRVETPMFPRTAFREILLNAIIHKDYSVGVPIQISVYINKMYVWNPGVLPKTLTIDMLFEKHSSFPRNPKIADVFFKTGMIETWGRGFDKIKIACQESHTDLPVWSLMMDGVMVHCNESKDYKILRENLLGIDDKGNAIPDKVVDKVVDKMVDKMTDKEKEIYKLLLPHLKEFGSISNNEAKEITGKPSTTIKRYLNKFCEYKILEPVGEKKARRYNYKESNQL